MAKDAEYYMEHPEEFEALGESEKAAIYLEEGETTGTSPAPAGEEKTAESAKEEPKPEEVSDPEKKPAAEDAPEEKPPEEPVIQAKDGKNVIPFSELEKAREETAKWKKAATEPYVPKMPENTPPEIAEKYAGKLTDLERRFSEGEIELPELLKERDEINAAITRDTFNWQVDQDQKARTAEQQAEDSRRWQEEQNAFFRLEENKVLVANPILYDTLNRAVVQIANSAQAATMTGAEILAEAKSHVAALYPSVFPKPADDGGKRETAVDLTKKAEEKIAAAKTEPPASLSEVPGSSAAHHDEAAALLEMSGTALMQKFEGKNPDQIEATLSRLL